MFLCIHMPPQQTAAWGLLQSGSCFCVSALCEELLAHGLGAIQLSIVCFACNCNSKVSAGLSNSEATTFWWDNLALFGARLVSAHSRPFHCVPLHHTGMSWSHLHAFLSLCIPPPFIWLHPKPLSVTNSFCRLVEHFCLVWGRGFFLGVGIFWLSAWNPLSLLLHLVYVELTAPWR